LTGIFIVEQFPAAICRKDTDVEVGGKDEKKNFVSYPIGQNEKRSDILATRGKSCEKG
jgi:hypothetical protein